MNAVIKAMGDYVPARRVHNNELAKMVDTSDEWIVSHTGISYRHLADESQAASDLGVEAAKKALLRAELKAEDLDIILVATATGDFAGFPSTACIIQDLLGAKNAAALDIVAGCTGFIYGLESARGYVATEFAKNILLIGTEVLSRFVDWEDRDTCVLFGDGAGAAVIQAEESDRGVLYSYMRSEGQGARLLERTAGGSRYPYKEGETNPKDFYLKMMDKNEV